MKLVVGGAHQGKSDIARSLFSFDGAIADGSIIAYEDIFSAVCVSRFHLFVRRFASSALPAEKIAEELIRRNPDIIVICDDIGCGIIPLSKEERVWRENVGRAGCALAAYADTVVRVVCSIPTAIKGSI